MKNLNNILLKKLHKEGTFNLILTFLNGKSIITKVDCWQNKEEELNDLDSMVFSNLKEASEDLEKESDNVVVKANFSSALRDNRLDRLARNSSKALYKSQHPKLYFEDVYYIQSEDIVFENYSFKRFFRFTDFKRNKSHIYSDDAILAISIPSKQIENAWFDFMEREVEMCLEALKLKEISNRDALRNIYKGEN